MLHFSGDYHVWLFSIHAVVRQGKEKTTDWICCQDVSEQA